jgi:lipid-A-disaccharide synthase
VDHVLCGLPFEPAWFAARGVTAEHGVSCEDVGHPFFDEAAGKRLDESFMAPRRASAGKSGRTVGVLPGSRDREVEANGPILAAAVRRLAGLHPDVTFRVAAFRPAHAARCRALFPGLPNVEICTDRTSEIIELSECCLFVSGSVSLELFARRTPGVMIYRTSRPTYWALEKLIVSESITLPNLFAGERLYPELFPPSEDCREVTELVRTIDNWLSAPACLEAVRRKIEAAAARTVKTGAASNAADAIARLVGDSPAVPATAPVRRAA